MKFVSITILILLSLLSADTALPCCYCGDTRLDRDLLESSTVFAGTVSSIDTLGMGAAMFSVNFEVTDVWSGLIKRQTSVFTYTNMFCGYTFRVGGSYIVVASTDEHHGLKTGMCSGTQFVKEPREFYSVLGEPSQRYE